MIGAVLRCWLDRCGTAALPPPDIVEELQAAPFRPYAFHLAVLPDARDFKVCFCALALEPLVGALPAGETLNANSTRMVDHLAGLGTTAVRAGKPVANSATEIGSDGNSLLYRLIIVPVGDGAGNVPEVFGAACFKVSDG